MLFISMPWARYLNVNPFVQAMKGMLVPSGFDRLVGAEQNVL